MADEVSGEPGRWRTFGEREVYRTPDVWFGQMDVELPDGERIWEPMLRLHQVAVMAVVDAQDRVLLIWRHRFVADRWGWKLPGGSVDEGEDPDQAAARIVEDAAGTGLAGWSGFRWLRCLGLLPMGRSGARPRYWG